MADFSNAKVGDKVYHLDYGECEITGIVPDSNIIEFVDKENVRHYCDKNSKCIYHSKTTITESKRMVKKEVNVFIDINFHKTDTIQTLTYQSGSICYPAKLTFEVEE